MAETRPTARITKNDIACVTEFGKRDGIPYTISDLCPECNAEMEEDLNDRSTRFLVGGKPDPVHFYCDECNHEWDVYVFIEITARLATSEELKG